jgi:hypothetical protein
MEACHGLRLCLIVLCLCSTALSGSRMTMEAKVAGRPVRLGLDTGSEKLCLFDFAARRLGLKVEPPPSTQADPGKVLSGRTEPCEFEIGPNKLSGPLPVVAFPGYLRPDIDGVIGWDFICRSVIFIDSVNMKVSVRKMSLQLEAPPETSEWSCWKIHPGARRLIIEIPGGGSTPETVMVDTGSEAGVLLAPHRWQQWVRADPDRPATLNGSFYPGVGIVATEERWARKFTLGDMALHEVPVGQYPAMIQHAPEDRHVATLGLCAVRRLSWLIDGPNGKVYFRGYGAPQGTNGYEYNRLGAVFIPVAGQGDALVAHVIPDGPAYRAGIRNGDALLHIGDLDATKWRTDPNVLPLARFWCQPAGIALHLRLQRHGEIVDVKPVLEDIFPASFVVTP